LERNFMGMGDKEDRRFGPYGFDEFLRVAEEFHGAVAPGLILGGYMVEMAKSQIPDGVLYDAISETASCLPDAIQLLTPCTIGNGWLKVIDLGLYALSLFDKYTGEGIRVSLDQGKLAPYGEIRAWYFKLKEKRDQDLRLIVEEIRKAGEKILAVRKIRVSPGILGKTGKGEIGVCPACQEGYPVKHGATCLSCQGGSPYVPRGRDPA